MLRPPSSKKSEVDEALFGIHFKIQILGNKKPSKTVGQLGNDATKAEEMKKIKEKALKGQQADAVVIKASELERIKASTKITGSKENESEEKKRMEEEKEKIKEAAATMKDKIKAFDQTRTKKLPISEFQKDTKEKNEVILEKAKESAEEGMDDVKHMNKMVFYAKCATVRDKQLIEKKDLEKQKKEEDARIDIMMEIERLKTLKFHEEQEKKHQEAQRQGALVIVDQIKVNEKEKEIKRQLKDKEQKEMLKHIIELQDEERKQQEEKMKRAVELMEVVKDSNKKAIEIKQQKTQEEKDLMQKIHDYNKQKAQKEEEYLAEQKRIHDEKEKEVQSLRDKQLKAINKQSEIDELKARRAFEESERQSRLREQREHEERVKSSFNLIKNFYLYID